MFYLYSSVILWCNFTCLIIFLKAILASFPTLSLEVYVNIKFRKKKKRRTFWRPKLILLRDKDRLTDERSQGPHRGVTWHLLVGDVFSKFWIWINYETATLPHSFVIKTAWSKVRRPMVYFYFKS